MDYDRTLSEATITRAVQTIDPSWTVERAVPASEGHHAVYHLTVDADGRRECVLKATPPEKPHACDLEARLFAVLREHTTVPVPPVVGVVDDHPDLPTPLFLSGAVGGDHYAGSEIGALSRARLRTLARSCGRHLASLHRLDAVASYGDVGVDPEASLEGGLPSADPDRLVVEDPTDDWGEYLRTSAEDLLDALGETRFDDVVETVRPVLEARIDAVNDDADPVLARIDNSLANLRVGEDGVAGMLDWEFCVATTPAYDLAFVEHSLAEGLWSSIPGVPDRRETVGEGLVEGYREAGDGRTVERFRTTRDCYALLSNVHAMVNFDDWFDQADADENDRERAADPLRERVERLC